MAEAETPSISSVENITSVTSPNENIPKEAALNAGENTVRRQSSINKNDVRRQSERLKERENSVKILVLGLTGAGKSTLVNAMMGDIMAHCQAGAKACSSGIECHKGDHDGIKIKIYDTAGFGENDMSEKKILENIAENTPRKGYDLILITLRMDSRLADNAKKMLSSLVRLMDPEMWKRTIVVLTFANFLVFQLENGYMGDNVITEKDELMKEYMEEQKKNYKEVFEKHTGQNLDEIPFVLAGSMMKRELPTDDDWLVTLWDQSILRCRTEVQPFLKRIRFKRLFVDLSLMIRNIFPITGDSERAEQHDERPVTPVQNNVEQSVGPECNGQGDPGHDEQVPLNHIYNGLEQRNNEQEEIRNDDCNLQEGLGHVDLNLLAEMSALFSFD